MHAAMAVHEPYKNNVFISFDATFCFHSIYARLEVTLRCFELQGRGTQAEEADREGL